MRRWDPVAAYIGSGEYVPDMEECERGDYVLCVDHVAALDALRREMARACEICGRAAQQMGTEARCAEHDSEKETGR